jgi:hypothetical protein
MTRRYFFIFGILALASFCGSSFAAHTVSSAWKFSTKVDSMTDEKECHLDGSTKEISMTFQSGNLYFVTGYELSPEETNYITLRVDKNPAFRLALRTVQPHLYAALNSEDVAQVLAQFVAGSSFKLRVLTLGGLSEDGGSLDGFDSAYEKYRACNSH